jgi:hypothetical protein
LAAILEITKIHIKTAYNFHAKSAMINTFAYSLNFMPVGPGIGGKMKILSQLSQYGSAIFVAILEFFLK